MPPSKTQFADLYQAQYDRIYRVCRAYTGDAEEAADLTQEVFIQAWKGLERFEGRRQTYTWLYRIAVNTCLMEKRKRRLAYQPLNEQVTGRTPDAKSSLMDERVSELYRHIAALPEADRLAISLMLEKVPYPDIAQTLGVSESNLRVRIHRIKKRLSKAFDHAKA